MIRLSLTTPQSDWWVHGVPLQTSKTERPSTCSHRRLSSRTIRRPGKRLRQQTKACCFGARLEGAELQSGRGRGPHLPAWQRRRSGRSRSRRKVPCPSDSRVHEHRVVLDSRQLLGDFRAEVPADRVGCFGGDDGVPDGPVEDGIENAVDIFLPALDNGSAGRVRSCSGCCRFC